MIRIEPLSLETIDAVSAKADAILTGEPEPPSFWYGQSLGIDVRHDVWEKYGTTSIRYWSARDDASQEFVGGTGFYTLSVDESEAGWLGWLWVDPVRRGEGLGRLLLNFVIDIARAEGKSYLRVYTSDEPEEHIANVLYEKVGFKEFRRIPNSNGIMIVYKELPLKP